MLKDGSDVQAPEAPPPKTGTLKDDQFHRQIARDIAGRPAFYQEAGDWLDQEFGAVPYWERRAKELEVESHPLRKLWARTIAEVKSSLTKAAVKRDKRRREQLRGRLAEITGCQRDMTDAIRRHRARKEDETPLDKLDRFLAAVTRCWEKPPVSLTSQDAKRVLLITWLMTDPTADQAHLGLTEFENWAWDIGKGRVGGRCHAGNWWRALVEKRFGWHNLVKRSWEVIQAESPSTTPAGQPAGPMPKADTKEQPWADDAPGAQMESWITDLAGAVHSVLCEPNAMRRFREMVKRFGKMEAAEVNATVGWEKLRNTSLRNVLHDPRLRDKEAGPPRPGWVWHSDAYVTWETLKRVPSGPPDVVEGWVPPEATKPRPQGAELINPTKPLPLEYKYARLAAIHDFVLTGVEAVFPPEWRGTRDGLGYYVLVQDSKELSGPDRSEREPARFRAFLEDVRADLKGQVRAGEAPSAGGPVGSGQSGGVRTKGMPQDEANTKARVYLKKHPNAKARELAREIGCSLGMVSGLPAWKAVNEQRKKGRKPKSPKVQRFNGKVEDDTGVGTKEDPLNRLIEEQKEDGKSDGSIRPYAKRGKSKFHPRRTL